MRRKETGVPAIALIVAVALHGPAQPSESPAASVQVSRVPDIGAPWASFRGSSDMLGRREGKVPDRLRKLWAHDAKAAIESTAAISDGRVFVGTEDGAIALKLAPAGTEGEVLWTAKLDSSVKASVLVVGDRVLVGNEGGVFHALDAVTGKAAWKFDTESGSEILSAANVSGGKVLFGSYDANLYCLDPATGKLVWKFETGGPVHSGPAVEDGHVFVAGCDGQLRAVSVADGKEVSAVELGGQSATSPCVSGSRLYVGNLGGEFLAVDWKASRVLWRYEHPDRQFPYHSSAALGPLEKEADGLVVVGGRDKMVHGLRARDGKEAWSLVTRAAVDASP